LLLGEREQAAALYGEWLAEEPDNPVVQHQLAACLGQAVPQRASDAYVEQVFDSFARSFDVKLQSLHYRAPELVTRALAHAVGGEPRAVLDIVDAGCGTGLCGPGLRPWARRLAGCDLSVGMLRQARPRGLYDVLHKAELVYYLQTQPAAFDGVISADTLCYFGDLDSAMAAAAHALRPGGWCIFTVEALAPDDGSPHRLQPNGRYAHSAAYLRAVLAQAGFQLHALEAVTLREEAGRPVQGWLVTAAAQA
jgi:predicted TPR repeat methyltransferase